MKRKAPFLATAALFCCMANVTAQPSANDTVKDTYMDRLAKYFTTSPTVDGYQESIHNFLISIIEESPKTFEMQGFPKAQIKSNAQDIATRYVDEVLPYDCARLLSSRAKALANEQELAGYAEVTPQQLADAKAVRHSLEKINDEKFIQVVNIFSKSDMQNAAKAIASGKKTVPIATNYSASYCTVFAKVSQIKHLASMNASATRKSWLNGGYSSQKAAAMEKYVLDNYPIAILNKLPEPPGEEQLRALTLLESIPAKAKLDAIQTDDAFVSRISQICRGWAIYYGSRRMADDYSRALSEYCRLGTNTYSSQFNAYSSVLEMVGTQIAEEDRANFAYKGSPKNFARECTDEYINQGYFADDIAYLILEPAFRDKVTIDDLSALKTLAEQPDVKIALQHVSEATNSEKYIGQTAKLALNYLTSALIASSPQKIKAEKCPKTYKAAFDLYMTADGSANIALESMMGAVEGRLQDNPDAVRILKSLKDYLQKNLPIAMRNAYYGTVTEQDLAILTTYHQNSTVKKVSATSIDMVKWVAANTEDVSEALMYKYSGWMLYYKTKTPLNVKPTKK